MELHNSIKYIAKQHVIEDVDFLNDVILMDDGNGPFIKEWNLDIPQPTEIELAVALALSEEEAKTEEYKKLREEAYPSIQEQLDMIYWDKIYSTSIWEDTITEVKSAFPKPL